jgi:hypothetical protein
MEKFLESWQERFQTSLTMVNAMSPITNASIADEHHWHEISKTSIIRTSENQKIGIKLL